MPSLVQPFLGVDVGAGVAVVGLVLVEDVAERVHVAVRVAVIRHPVGVGREPLVHRVLERTAVVHVALGQRRMRESYGLAALHERRRLLPLGIGDQVHGPELVVLPHRPQFDTCLK